MRSITLFFVAAAMAFSSCGTIKIIKVIGKETVSPTAFKVQIPFIHPKNDRLFIPVFFGKENVTRTLLFDSHAPFCLFESTIKNNAAISKVGKYYKNRPTPEGKTLPNIFYKTDNIKLGNVRFDKVVINQVPDRTDTINFRYEGIFGTNAMVKGIWKIDFEHNQLVFASAIDSIENVAEAQKLETEFVGISKIKVNLTSENNVKVILEVDLGSNRSVSLQKEVFDQIDVTHKATVTQGTVITASGETKVTKYALSSVPIKLGDKDFTTALSTNNLMKKNLLGIGFFDHFKFVIFDYINKAIYVSNEKMPK
jgi:hypothetical protein